MLIEVIVTKEGKNRYEQGEKWEIILELKNSHFGLRDEDCNKKKTQQEMLEVLFKYNSSFTLVRLFADEKSIHGRWMNVGGPSNFYTLDPTYFPQPRWIKTW